MEDFNFLDRRWLWCVALTLPLSHLYFFPLISPDSLFPFSFAWLNLTLDGSSFSFPFLSHFSLYRVGEFFCLLCVVDEVVACGGFDVAVILRWWWVCCKFFLGFYFFRFCCCRFGWVGFGLWQICVREREREREREMSNNL